MKKLHYTLPEVGSRAVRVKYMAIGILVGALCGLLTAFFLFSLEGVINVFSKNTWLLYGLPLGGLIVGLLYWKLGKSSDRGNEVIKDEVKFPFEKMPVLMAPLVFISTLVTHLFGGSAGREGTAVQITTSVADQFSSLFQLKNEKRPWIIRMAISGGFAAVFGTPLAGLVFSLEYILAGKKDWNLIFPNFLSAGVAHLVCQGMGVEHTNYEIDTPIVIDQLNGGVYFLVAIVVGLLATLYMVLQKLLTKGINRLLEHRVLRTMIGGVVVAVIILSFDLKEYSGLSLEIITTSFSASQEFYVPLIKILLTALTLSFGFKGGEVTPLFMIGAAAGSCVGGYFNVPLDWMAAMGFVAMFGAVMKAPITGAAIALEIFAPEIFGVAIGVCLIAYIIPKLLLARMKLV
jgi:H+/Cl- antiporter ClcA